jgi:hypothetical protein
MNRTTLNECAIDAKKLKDLIGEAIDTTFRHVFAPLEIATPSNQDWQSAGDLLCKKAQSRDDCVMLVLSGRTPQSQLEKFFFGLGSVFHQMRDSRELCQTSRHTPLYVVGIAQNLNILFSEIKQKFGQLYARPPRDLRITGSICQRFLVDILEDPLKTGLKVRKDSFTAFLPNAYVEDFGNRGSSNSSDQASIELQQLREALVAAEYKAAENALALAEARECELRALKSIAEAQKDIARLTEAVCTLRAENQGLRSRLYHPPLQCDSLITDEDGSKEVAEKYPIGKGDDPLEWLKVHYGHKLTYFGASEDTLFQDQLRKSDPGLLRALENRLYYAKKRNGGTGVSLREIIPAKTDRSTRRLALASVSVAAFESDPSLLSILRHRLR